VTARAKPGSPEAFVNRWRRRWPTKDFDARFAAVQAQLSAKFGKPASPQDTIWRMLNERFAHFEQGLMLHEEGRDPRGPLLQARQAELKQIMSALGPQAQVEILAYGVSCPACKALGGRKLPAAQALKDAPLPCAACTNDPNEKGFGWCRCLYVAVTRFD
jgi:hypothetical protein